jgi:hypothetical protein
LIICGRFFLFSSLFLINEHLWIDHPYLLSITINARKQILLGL